MQKIDDLTIYENRIEELFLEYFENRDIDILHDYKTIPNSVYQASFKYIYKHLFKGMVLDYKCITTLQYMYDIYTDLIYNYNIIPFYNFFYCLYGISIDDIRRYIESGKASDSYINLAKKIEIITGDQVRNKLADDKIGLQSLANNDTQVGLRYNQQKQIENAISRQLTIDSLPDLRIQGIETSKD